MVKWKDISGFVGSYQVSDTGLVKSLDRKRLAIRKGKKVFTLINGKMLTQTKKYNGYLSVGLYGAKRSRYVTVHRLVAEAFIENNNNKPCVNHINFNKEDNNVSNLEWVTQKENVRHTIKHGRRANVSGSRHPSSILNEKKVLEIRFRIDNGEKQADLMREFNVSRMTISKIYLRKSWVHI